MPLLLNVVGKGRRYTSARLVTVEDTPQTPSALNALFESLLATSAKSGDLFASLKLTVPSFSLLSPELEVGRAAEATYSEEMRLQLVQPPSAEEEDEEQEPAVEAEVPTPKALSPLLPNLHYSRVSLALKARQSADGCASHVAERERACAAAEQLSATDPS